MYLLCQNKLKFKMSKLNCLREKRDGLHNRREIRGSNSDLHG